MLLISLRLFVKLIKGTFNSYFLSVLEISMLKVLLVFPEREKSFVDGGKIEFSQLIKGSSINCKVNRAT